MQKICVRFMYIPWPFLDLVDVVCLRGHWTLEINLLGLLQGGGVPAVLGGVSVVATFFYSQNNLHSSPSFPLPNNDFYANNSASMPFHVHVKQKP